MAYVTSSCDITLLPEQMVVATCTIKILNIGTYRHKMDGGLTCDFTSFPTVFQSYQDDGQMIMEGCVR